MDRLIVIMFVLGSAAGCAGLEWSKADTARQVAITGVIAIDCTQTHKIVDDPDRYERNPLLGPYPTHEQVNAWCAAGALAAWGIAAILPPKWRARFQWALLIVEGAVVWSNFNSE